MSSPITSRTNVRLLVRMPLTVAVGKRSCPVQTEAVWSGGVVVRCDLPIAARQLVKLQVPIPPDGTVLTLNAMVDEVRPPAPGVAPALTLSLYGNSGPPVDRWSAFLADIRAKFPDATSQPVVSETVSQTTPDAVHREQVRFFASFEVKVSTVDELTTLVTRDISRGGLFLRTRRAAAVGDELHLEIVHPIRKETFTLRGLVRHRSVDRQAPGLGVELVGLDDARRKALWEFVSSGLPDDGFDVDVDVELIED